MKNNKNSNMLWFFSDYNDTFDIIENDTNKVEKLFNLLDDISNLKNLDKIAFSFVSLNNCEFLRNILLKIKNIINNPSSNIKNKDKILLFSALGDNGYMLFPCNEDSSIIHSPHIESKARQMYKLLHNIIIPGEFIYSDDCPAYNLEALSKYHSVNPIKGIKNFTFIGPTNNVINNYPSSFNTILDNSDEFLINGLERYKQVLLNKEQEKEI